MSEVIAHGFTVDIMVELVPMNSRVDQMGRFVKGTARGPSP